MRSDVRPGEGQNLNLLDANAALRQLIRVLTRSGYSEFCASFNPLAPRLESWIAHRNDAVERLRPLIDLFLLGRRVPVSHLGEDVVELLPSLSSLGVPSVDSEGLAHASGLVLYRVFGLWLFFEQPSINPKLYFGDDSVALLSRLTPPRGGSTLDLCAGPGIQSLLCAQHAKRVIAVEVNPVAAALAEMNAAINGLENVRVICGDLREVLQGGGLCGERFDHCVANPPLLPFPDEIPYPFVGHGGPDGLRLTWRILEALPAVLEPGGVAQIIGAGLSDGILPLFFDPLRDCARAHQLRVLVTVLSHQHLTAGSEFFDGMVFTATGGDASRRSEVAAGFERFLADQGATHLCAFFFHATRGPGSVELQDLSRDGRRGLWYA